MTDLFTQLSRLYDGDLPPDQSEALEHRIATEPEVAQAWDELTAMVAQLDALPVVFSDPPPVVMPSATPTPANRPWWPIAVGGALLLAAGLLVVVSPPPPTTVALGHGVHAIDGQTTVHVMGVQVDVDGRAALSVEPAGDLPRVDMAEDPMNALTHAAALATGAILTVTVYEGTAAVRGPDASTHVVTPEHPLSVRTAQGADRVVADAATTEPVVVQTAPSATVEDLERTVAALQEENDALRMAATFAQGQLAAVEGEPRPWPAEVHRQMQPDTFTDAVQAAVDLIDGAALLDVDCAEYPCIAHIDVPPGGRDDMDAFVSPLADALSPGDDDPGLMVMMSETDDGTGPMATLSVALAVEVAEGPDPRIEGRVRDFLDRSAP